LPAAAVCFACNSAHEDPNEDDGVVSIKAYTVRLGGIRLPVCIRVWLRQNVVPKRVRRSS